MPITKADKQFIKELLADELEYDRLEILDEKLKDPIFKAAYEKALDEKYSSKKGLIVGYLPMFVLGTLVLIGLYLIFGK